MSGIKKSRTTWNSDAIHRKKELIREKPKLAWFDSASASPCSSDTEGSHDSFPVHGLGAETGYACELSAVTGQNDDAEEVRSEPPSSFPQQDAPPKRSADDVNISKALADKVSRTQAPQKVLLRPYGVSNLATSKAEQLREAIMSDQGADGSIVEVVIGERIAKLDHLCAFIDGQDRVTDYAEKVLHRESSVDVRVVNSDQFGEVVQKTYLKQTMRAPHRPHSCMQDQLLYEASILKSLSRAPGIVRLLGWCHTTPEQLNCTHLSGAMNSLLYEYIPDDMTPTEPQDIRSYMKQLLNSLDHLHCRGIVHCNMKRENVLFDGSVLTIIDFETAVNEHELIDMGDDAYEEEATVYYRSNPYFSAPEVMEMQPGRSKHGRGILYGHRRDIWGAGIMLTELLFHMNPDEHLFPNGERHERIQARRDFCEALESSRGVLGAFKGLRRMGRNIGHEIPITAFYKHAADLVKHTTLWCRFKRARAWEALQHTFFTVDPLDTTEEPEFHTLRPDPVQHRIEEECDENEGFLALHEDDYLREGMDVDDERFTWRNMYGDGVGDMARQFGWREEMDPEDIYWYGKEGTDYLISRWNR